MNVSDKEAPTMGTQPTAQHNWLRQFEGDWDLQIEMTKGPGGEVLSGVGQETARMLGELWLAGYGTMTTQEGEMKYVIALGFDVTFQEYCGCWFSSFSSHLWKSTGALSPDEKVMTLRYEAPHIGDEGSMANYQDVIRIESSERHTLVRSIEVAPGEWAPFVNAVFTRAE